MKSLPHRAPWPLLLLLACGPSAETPNEPLGTSTEALFYKAAFLRAEREVPVCWLTEGYTTEKGWVRDALRGQRSWMRSANLNFVGLGDCGPETQQVAVEIGGCFSAAYEEAPLTELMVSFP